MKALCKYSLQNRCRAAHASTAQKTATGGKMFMAVSGDSHAVMHVHARKAHATMQERTAGLCGLLAGWPVTWCAMVLPAASYKSMRWRARDDRASMLGPSERDSACKTYVTVFKVRHEPIP